MMKSFFKKLSLVMALAMVVSMMAPAASAFAADLVIAEQTEAKADAKAEYSVEVGKEVDFKFYGANAGWQDLYKWESGDEAVAKTLVNEEGVQEGKFLGVKDGKVEITLTIGEQKATVVLVVGKGEVVDDKAFTVKQLEANKLELTFADKANATKAISVEKVVKTADGDKTMVWVLNESKTSLKDNVVTIEPWVNFGNATYKITANGVTEEFTTAVGNPAVANLSYAKPYPYTKAGVPAAKTLVVTDANGVKVADSAYSAYYELVKAEPAGYAYVNSTNGDLYFYADNAYAEVKVTIQYYVGTELKKFEYVEKVQTQPVPVVTMNPAFDSVAVVAKGTDADKIVWNTSEVRMGSTTNYQVVGLIKDSSGASFAVNAASVGKTDANKNQLKVTEYALEYESTDTSKVLVNKLTGELVGVNQGSAYILVTMYKLGANNAKDSLGIVAAVPVTVTPKNAADYVTLDTTFAVLLTSGHYATKKVTPQTWNNYGEKMDDTIKSVTATFNNVSIDAEIVDGGKSFVVDAAAANAKLNAGAIKTTQFTYKVTMTSGKTADFVLTIKDAPTPANEVYRLSATGAVVKADKLGEKVSINVVSEVLGEKYLNKDFYYGKVDVSKAKEGDLYVVVLDKDQKPVTPATAGATVPKYEAKAVTNTATGTALTTLPTGNYLVKLYKVIAVVNGVIVDAEIDSAVYTVDNQVPTYATDVTPNLKTKLGLASGKATYVDGMVDFKVNGDLYSTNKAKFTVVGVDSIAVGTDKAFVYSVKVKYTVGDYFVEVTVPVNQTYDLAQ